MTIADATFVVLTLTLLAVIWYAWEARKQAQASRSIADEMTRTRVDDSRPALALRWIAPGEFGTGPEAMSEALAELWDDTHVTCGLVNIVRGPALNITADVLSANGQISSRHLGTLAPGIHDERPKFAVQEGSISVSYQDIWGRTFVSRRDVTVDSAGPHVGELKVGLKAGAT